MKTIASAAIALLLSTAALQAADDATTPLEAAASESSRAAEAKKNNAQPSDRGVSAVVSKPKLRSRIKGNFKGKDPMIAPDGEIRNEPTDGSRPKSK